MLELDVDFIFGIAGICRGGGLVLQFMEGSQSFSVPERHCNASERG